VGGRGKGATDEDREGVGSSGLERVAGGSEESFELGRVQGGSEGRYCNAYICGFAARLMFGLVPSMTPLPPVR
jgi:hypothetical protein